MQDEVVTAMTNANAATGRTHSEAAAASGRYTLECRDKDGNLKWADQIDNLVTTAGKNDALDKYLAGSGYTAAWYLGLIGATGYTLSLIHI